MEIQVHCSLVLVVVAIRAGFMLFMLNRNKDGIT